MERTSPFSGVFSRRKLERRWYANTPLKRCQAETQIDKKTKQKKKFVGHLTFAQSRQDQLSFLEMSTKSLSEETSEAETADLISLLEGDGHLIQKACSAVIQRSRRFLWRNLTLSPHVGLTSEFWVDTESKTGRTMIT